MKLKRVKIQLSLIKEDAKIHLSIVCDNSFKLFQLFSVITIVMDITYCSSLVKEKQFNLHLNYKYCQPN